MIIAATSPYLTSILLQMASSSQSASFPSKYFVATLYQFSETAQREIIRKFRALPDCGSAKVCYNPEDNTFEIDDVPGGSAHLMTSLNDLVRAYIKDGAEDGTSTSLLKGCTPVKASVVHKDGANDANANPSVMDSLINPSVCHERWSPVDRNVNLSQILSSDEFGSLRKEVTCRFELDPSGESLLLLHPASDQPSRIMNIIQRLNVIEEILKFKAPTEHVFHLTSSRLSVLQFQFRICALQDPKDGTLLRSINPAARLRIDDRLMSGRACTIRAVRHKPGVDAYVPWPQRSLNRSMLAGKRTSLMWSMFLGAFWDIGESELVPVVRDEPALPEVHFTNPDIVSWMDTVEIQDEPAMDNPKETKALSTTSEGSILTRSSYSQTSKSRPLLPSLPPRVSYPPLPPEVSGSRSPLAMSTSAAPRSEDFITVQNQKHYHHSLKPNRDNNTEMLPQQIDVPSLKAPQSNEKAKTSAGKFKTSNPYALIEIDDYDESTEVTPSVLRSSDSVRKENTWNETKESFSEVDTRQRMRTGKKKKPSPASKDELATPNRQKVDQWLDTVLSGATKFRGQLQLVLEIGQFFCGPRQTNSQDPITWNEISTLLSTGPDFAKTSFSKAVTTSEHDTAALLESINLNSPPFVTNSVWELSCTASQRDAVSIWIEAQQTETPRSPKVTLSEKPFGIRYIHGVDANYDARLTIRGIATADISKIPGAEELLRVLHVRSEAQDIPTVSGRDGDLYVDKIRLHCSMKYKLPDQLEPIGCYLEFVRVYDLFIRRGDPAISENAGLFQGYPESEAELAKHGRLWYEINLGLISPPAEWSENLDLSPGKEAKWRGKTVVSSDQVLALESCARHLLECMANTGFGDEKSEIIDHHGDRVCPG